MKALVCYISYSGNTEEVAELIEETLLSHNHEVELYRVGLSEGIPDFNNFDIVFMGTFTWGDGRVPSDMKNFITEIGYKPKNIVLFGTGDTQFGGDLLFCGALDRLKKFYNSEYDVLKIEQSPRGKQEERVIDWTEGVIGKWKN